MISINRIIIKNFRQYRDINLNFKSKNGLFLFIGKNGMGKSNFLNAICWCLYGTQPFKFHDSDKELLNDESAKLNEFDEVKVSIELTVDDKTIMFVRTQRETQEWIFTAMIKQGEDWPVAPNPTVLVNNLLPESVSKFFLFDGEAVQNLYKADYSKKLKDGVWRVSNVELLDRASEHLYRTREDVRRFVSKDEPASEIIESRLSELEKQKIELEKDLKQRQDELVELKQKKGQFSEEMKRFEKYRGLQEKRDLLENNVNDAKNRLEEYQRQINDLIVSYSPFWYVKETLVEVAGKINDASNKGQLPPKIKSTFIKELFEKGECICGTSIAKDSKEHAKLMKLLTDVEPLASRSYLLEDKIEINSLLKVLQNDLPEKFKQIREQKSRERIAIEGSQLSLKEVKEQLMKAPDAQVGNIESTIQRLEDQIDLCSQECWQTTEKIRLITQEIGGEEDTLDKLIRGKSKKQLEQKKLDFLEEAKDASDYVREKLIDQIRRIISSKTNQFFKELIWKKDEFDSVSFTEDYKVEIFKRNDKVNSLEVLSTGEMKVLSFATIKALAQLSGFNNMPVFIDGPLENLDKEVRSNFLKSLSSFITDKQVFVFSLDGDLIEEFGNEHVSPENFFRLNRKDGSSSTLIRSFNE